MGKSKRDKVGKALRDNPISGGGGGASSSRTSLGDQIHADRFVIGAAASDKKGPEDEVDPEVS